ncbi:uncharacterized protein LOC132735254 isoform X2 [Ruditapes philippinarum]|nr:uncharacterized protein LOC132735254 isoform X2 [Ruditapes philippinarum]
MGCSSSMNVPLSSGEMPTKYSDENDSNETYENQNSEVNCSADMLENSLHNEQHHCDACMNSSKPSDNIHIKNTRILFFSHDSRNQESTDASSVVPIFNTNEHDRTMHSCNTCLPVCGHLHNDNARRDSRSMSLTGGIKSVLKSGRNDPRNDMLANRPIKTVTFVESVTVVTVY